MCGNYSATFDACNYSSRSSQSFLCTALFSLVHNEHNHLHINKNIVLLELYMPDYLLGPALQTLMPLSEDGYVQITVLSLLIALSREISANACCISRGCVFLRPPQSAFTWVSPQSFHLIFNHLLTTPWIDYCWPSARCSKKLVDESDCFTTLSLQSPF